MLKKSGNFILKTLQPCVNGYRNNKKYVTARLVVAPRLVAKSDIDILFSRWGKVIIGSERGSSTLSFPSDTVGIFESRWVWNKEWVVKVERDDTTTIPTCILACGDVWRIKYLAAPVLCFMCGDTSH